MAGTELMEPKSQFSFIRFLVIWNRFCNGNWPVESASTQEPSPRAGLRKELNRRTQLWDRGSKPWYCQECQICPASHTSRTSSPSHVFLIVNTVSGGSRKIQLFGFGWKMMNYLRTVSSGGFKSKFQKTESVQVASFEPHCARRLQSNKYHLRCRKMNFESWDNIS